MDDVTALGDCGFSTNSLGGMILEGENPCQNTISIKRRKKRVMKGREDCIELVRARDNFLDHVLELDGKTLVGFSQGIEFLEEE